MLLLCSAAVAAAAVLHRFGSQAFVPYFGDANPILVTAFLSLVGGVSLGILQRYSWFATRGRGREGLAVAALVGVALTIPVIVVDALGGFEEGINVRAPESLLFNPAIAVVAEIVFHVAPLAVLAALATRTRLGRERARAYCMVAVSLLEPTIQVVWGSAHSPLWANIYVGAHILIFNLIGLHLFKRYGFLEMYSFRAVYYLIWHVGWGIARLELLFGG